MKRGDELCRRAQTEAKNWLQRCRDAWTREHRDDLVQETSLAAWKWAAKVRHEERFGAAVRTIARRVRCRAMRSGGSEFAAQTQVETAVTRADESERHYVICGRRMPASVVRPYLSASLRRLAPIDRELLLGFYEGFCCAELAVRFRRSTACVKTRIHRARRRVRRAVEVWVRTSTVPSE